ELRAGVPCVVAPIGAGLQARSGELRVTIDGADGRRSAALDEGVTAEVTLGALTFRVSSVTAAKRMPRSAGADARGLGSSFLATFAAVATFLGTLAYYTPAMGSTLDDGLDREQLATMLAILKADAEQERKVTPSEGDSSSVQGGGTPGTAAKGPEGKMGRPDKPSVQKKFAIQGDGDVVLSRPELVAEAMNFGTVGLLNALNGRSTPQALWGESVPNGPDTTDRWGEMFGESIDESGGAGGLGLSGPGFGGGGYGEQIGIGSIGTCGTNCGMGPGKWGIGPGMGKSLGNAGGGHVTKAPSVRAGKTTVNGHIPAEVIQRIVRQNYGRFRQCYESGLRANPNLTGRVSARFVIGRDGSVTNVTNGGGDLPDSAVTSCVLSAFYGISFPSPDGGIVTVTYPIMLVPG
ncbi:MAG TPA: AgmX/PglI C-terminal domain-containing protein, partial [Polyangiaceae bacterium]